MSENLNLFSDFESGSKQEAELPLECKKVEMKLNEIQLNITLHLN